MSASLTTAWLDRVRIEKAWRLSVAAAPGAQTATAAELQNQARVLFPGESDPFGGAEDSLLEMYIEAAAQEIDAPLGWLGRSLITRTLRISLDAEPGRIVRLPGGPIQSIAQVAYTDPSGVEVIVLEAALEAAGYRYDLEDTGEPSLIWNDDPGWPSTEARPGRIRIDYVAGYGVAAAIPNAIRHWILARAAEMYRDREASTLAAVTIPEHVRNSIDVYRIRMS